MKYFSESSGNKYIIWFEEKGKGSIKNAYGQIQYYYSKDVFNSAKGFAEKYKENVLIQRGRKIWRVIPREKIEALKEGTDYKIKESN